MYISKEKFEQIKEKCPLLLVVDQDAVDALVFVSDLLYCEANALEEKEPSAWKTIEDLRHCAFALWSLSEAIEEDNFNEGETSCDT